MSGYVLVTGASKGIGREIAREYARRGRDLVLVARSRDLLEQFASELRNEFGIQVDPVVADFTKPAAIRALVMKLDAQGLEVTGLVNNAGIGTIGYYDSIDAEMALRMIDLNVRALTYLSTIYLPRFKAKGSGFILNIASVVGLTPVPLMATYAATKAYVVSLSESLAVECVGTGVTVTCICPGYTETEFARTAGIDEKRAFKGSNQSAEAVARYAVAKAEGGSRFGIPGLFNRLTALSIALVPRILAAWSSYFVTKTFLPEAKTPAS